MTTTLHEVLDWKTLTGLVQDPKGGLATPGVPPSFLQVRRGIVGDKLTYYRVAGTRQTALVAQRASASQRRQMQGVTEHNVKLLFVNENMQHDVDILNNLRNFDNPQLQRLGEQEIARQVAYTRTYLDNFRTASIMSVLFSGYLRYTFGQSLHDPNSGTGTQIDFGVPAGNRNQLDWDGNGAIIGASWGTTSTDIAGDVEAVKNAGMRLTGYPIVHAFYGANIRNYLGTNDSIKEFIKGNQALSASFAQNQIPLNFLDLQWHSASGLFFNDESDSVVDVVPADAVVFTPEPSPEWWEPTDGSFEIPTSQVIAPTVEAALAQFTTVQGMWNYANVTLDPAGIKHVYGDTFLPVLKVPKAVFIADVTP